MAKSANKATRKLIKKGQLDFASRVHRKKGGGGPGAKRGQGGKRPLGGAGAGGHKKPRPQSHGGSGLRQLKRKHEKEDEGEEDGDGEQQQQQSKGGSGGGGAQAIEDMDVDAFMSGGMFGDGDGSGSEGEEEAAEEEEDALEGEEELEDGSSDDEGDEEGDDLEGSSSEEEEDSEVEGMEDDVKRHKAELERLKEQDPEFFKFLEKNDGRLLEFGEGEEEEEDESEDEDEEEPALADEEDEEEPEEEEGKGPKELTLALLKQLEHSALESHSLKGLRKLILAFKAASHVADESSSKGSGIDGHKLPFTIASSAVFDRLLVTCLTAVPGAFGHHLFGDEDFNAADPQPFSKLGSNPNFRRLKPLVYRALKALHYLLGQVTEPSLLAFLLARLERFLPFLIPFPKQAKYYLKTLLSLWATNADLSVKVAAFLRIRQAATVLPFPFLEHCLKGAYLAYARSAKFMSEAALPGLTLMGNCLVELYGLDMTSSYQHAFVYLRQLALHLRAAYTKKTPEALQKVYCWQYLNCLRVWAAVLTAYCDPPIADPDQQQLRELVFPLTQIIIGVVRLAPSARHCPLILHCLTLLQRLAAAAQVFVPCAATVLDLLESPSLLGTKKPKPTTEAPPNLALAVRLGKGLLEPKNVQEAVVAEAMDVLSQELLVYRYTVAFPEYAFPIQERLKRFAKQCKPQRWRALARGLVDEAEKRAAYVEKERARRELAPTDSVAFEALKPQGEPGAAARLRVFLEAKAQRAGLAVAPAPTKEEVAQAAARAQQAAAARGDESDDGSDEESEEEERPVKPQQKGKGKKPVGAGAGWGLESAEQVERLEDEVGELGEWSDSDGEDGDGMKEGSGSDEEEEEEESE